MNVTNKRRKHKSCMLMLVTYKMDKFSNVHIYCGEMECHIYYQNGSKAAKPNKNMKNTGRMMLKNRQINQNDDDCFHIALFSALEQTHCARM